MDFYRSPWTLATTKLVDQWGSGQVWQSPVNNKKQSEGLNDKEAISGGLRRRHTHFSLLIVWGFLQYRSATDLTNKKQTNMRGFYVHPNRPQNNEFVAGEDSHFTARYLFSCVAPFPTFLFSKNTTAYWQLASYCLLKNCENILLLTIYLLNTL